MSIKAPHSVRISKSFLVLYVLHLTVASTVLGLEVLGVVGGRAVVNGSAPLVVLDCNYIIPLGEEAGLVVKWYYGSQPRPVYQWIYGSPPQALGLLRDRVNLRYQPSPDRLKAHSALAFVAPTTELAGQYTCRVATYLGEDSATGRFVDYTPASEFDLKISKPTFGKVVIWCGGREVYPEPNIVIFKTDVKSRRLSTGRAAVTALRKVKYFDDARNLHSVAAEASILGNQLIGETEFECILSVPGTDYRLRETLLYHPGGYLLGHQLVGGSEFECILSVTGADYTDSRKPLIYNPGFPPSATAEAVSGRNLNSRASTLQRINSRVLHWLPIAVMTLFLWNS